VTRVAPACAECGAEQPEGGACRACFHALLAYEAERPAAFGAVHHLTVATYFLQHPAGYTPRALDAWHALVDDALGGRASVAELRERMGREFAGAARTREPGATPPTHWPARWPLSVRDVIDPRQPLPEPDEYVARALRWAAAARDTLAAVHGAR